MSLPLMVRPASIIAIGTDETRPDYSYADGVIFHVFEPAEGSACTASVTSTEGSEEAALSVMRERGTLTIKHQGVGKLWSVCLRNQPGVSGVKNGSPKTSPDGVMILPAEGAKEITVRL
jgi:alpha-D-xyloside xylohydrolase